jgi:hypothetical protein
MNCRHQVSTKKFISDINNTGELKRENITKAMTNIDSLINKKFNLNSAFDHKGAKNFLNSKKIALQQIILDDDESTDIDPKNMTNEHLKNSNKHKNISGKSLKKEERNIINSNNTTVMKKSLKKKKEEKNILNEYFSNAYESPTNNRKYFSNKKINKKLPHKFYSNQELKMFEDKEIKKIKSIRKDKKRNKSNKNNIESKRISFMEKTDSSIFEIIAQLK